MKFRRKSDRTVDVASLSSLIATGVEIVGDVIITDGLRIDGRVQGDVRVKPGSRGLLALSECGSVQGSVHVYDAVINGTIDGDVEVEHFLELQPGARVTGSIRYRQLRMECGARVDGRLEHVAESGATASTPASDNVVAIAAAR